MSDYQLVCSLICKANKTTDQYWLAVSKAVWALDDARSIVETLNAKGT